MPSDFLSMVTVCHVLDSERTLLSFGQRSQGIRCGEELRQLCINSVRVHAHMSNVLHSENIHTQNN